MLKSQDGQNTCNGWRNEKESSTGPGANKMAPPEGELQNVAPVSLGRSAILSLLAKSENAT
jgi:hypothetical protein